MSKIRILPVFFILGLLPAGEVFSANPAVRVFTKNPQAAPEQKVMVEQPAEVSAYYQVGLLPKVAGTVKILEKTLGDKVTAGEVLVQLDTGDPSGAMASITAPFDGVISARAADPGLFVASAAVVPDVNSLLTVDRTDIVTVSMSVPETYVSCLSMDTMAEIRMNALPGRVFRCPLSRIAPALNAEDRTLRVEVDLFNGTSDAYSQMKVRAESNGFADLKSRKLPFFPEGMTAGQSVGLLPGMYGTMNLVMPVASSALLVPSSAIVRDGGMTYLYENEKGVARRRSIVVQMDNGVSAAVRWSSNGTTQDLSGREEIITSNQGELEDGTAIEATLAN